MNEEDPIRMSENECTVLSHLSDFMSVVPMNPDEITKIRNTILRLKNFKDPSTSPTKSKQMRSDVRQLLPHVQVQNIQNLHEEKKTNESQENSPNSSPSSSPYRKPRKSGTGSQINETSNPVIKCFWLSKLPHPDGFENSVGNPLSKLFQSYIANGNLHCDQTDEKLQTLAEKLLREKIQCSFWQSYSSRIRDQIVVWIREPEGDDCGFGAIVPQVITSGTVSRRAVEPLWLTASNVESERVGSELKALVQTVTMNKNCPGDEYVFVGADVDSQEMWIAGLIGDAKNSIQGSSPFSWMMLQGNKKNGTDLHSKIANDHKISRDAAKVLNYARLYGAGLDFTETLLKRFCQNISDDQANRKAYSILAATKGKKNRNGPEKGLWYGGTESVVFNEMEKIAKSENPKTPFLNASITEGLNPAFVKNDFLPSRVNWVVQSSAVDYLHVMLTSIRWLCEHRAERFKFTPRLALSIHDEMRYIVHKEDSLYFGYILQISNLITRAFFVHRLGMRDLPKSVAYFSSIEIDHCLRKDPTNDCVTPSNPTGLSSTYQVPKGYELQFEQLVEEMRSKSIFPYN